MSNDYQSGAAPSAQKSHADLIAEMRWQAKQPVIASGGEVFHPVDESDILDFAKDLESAHKRELDAKDIIIRGRDVEIAKLKHEVELCRGGGAASKARDLMEEMRRISRLCSDADEDNWKEKIREISCKANWCC